MPLTYMPRTLTTSDGAIIDPEYIGNLLGAGTTPVSTTTTTPVLPPMPSLPTAIDPSIAVAAGDKTASGGAPAGTGGQFVLPRDDSAPHDDPTPKMPPSTPSKVDWLNRANQGFGYNYGRRLVPDDIVNGTIQSILDEQRGNAQSYLDRGKARGIYNELGYGAGLARIGNSTEAGRSQLSTLGSDVLGKYRTQANNVRDDAYSTISGLLDGQDFSLDPYFSEGTAIGDTARHNAGGDLRTALGGQNFFDFTGLHNAAGAAQGALNLPDSDITSALAERKRKSAQGRGLGSTGDF